MKNYIDRIASLGACDDAIKWLRREAHPNLAAAWAACPRADWMLWLAARYYTHNITEQRRVVGAGAECAAAVLDLVPPGNDCFHTAVETAQRWAQQEATPEEVRKAASTAALGLLKIEDTIGTENRLLCAATSAFQAANAATSFTASPSVTAAVFAEYAAVAAGRKIDFAGIVRRYIPNPPTLQE